MKLLSEVGAVGADYHAVGEACRIDDVDIGKNRVHSLRQSIDQAGNRCLVRPALIRSQRQLGVRWSRTS